MSNPLIDVGNRNKYDDQQNNQEETHFLPPPNPPIRGQSGLAGWSDSAET